MLKAALCPRIAVGNRRDMLDPLKLMGRLMVAFFKITGYSIVYLAQAVWFAAHRRNDKFGDTMGYWGKATTDALADIFKR